ncbi:MAG: carbonic anhydrase [Deltaproteobacteria bacterium]|nr:MAG: carbonic anhydrase [Deltaproteobacteria bacterium]
MRKLIQGIHRFHKQYWSANRELYRRLADHGQFPEALFITCCDSRVDPLTITHGQPGDLFIMRNIGNFVPPFTENRPDGTGVAAAVEYAVVHLEVRDIVVCGHSDCGALKALYQERTKFTGTPHIAEWLAHGDRTMAVVAANYPELSREERYEITAEENVLVQMENLRTYPVVRKAAQEGRLHVHAWYYDIGAGTVYRYSPEREQFEPIREEEH